jgi:hypothetical protein
MDKELIQEIRALRADVQALPKKTASALSEECVRLVKMAFWWLMGALFMYGVFQIVKKWLF